MNDRFGMSSVGRRAVLKGIAGSTILPLVGGFPNAASAQEPVEIVIWQWAPGFESYIDAFNRSHPGIVLKQVLTTNSQDTGLKLRNALLAGSGGPDITFCNYWMVPSMDYAGAFRDITEQAASVKDRFVPAFVEASTFDGKIKLIPLDAPPLLQFYRADILEGMGLSAPETWDDLARAAEVVRSKSPDSYITNATFTNGEWVTALCWQAGWKGFKLDGTTLTVDVNGAAAQKVAQFWQPLLDGKLVSADLGFTNDFYHAVDNGKYLSLMMGSWFPAVIGANASQTLGKWRTAFVPRWQKGDDFSPLFGGAGFGVFSQTKHPDEAWEVLKWLTTESPAKEMWVTQNSLVPTLTDVLADPAMQGATFAFTGDQKVNEIAFKAVTQVKKPFIWAPFQDFVLKTLEEEVGAAASGSGTLLEGFGRAQDKIVAYATEQGFTVA